MDAAGGVGDLEGGCLCGAVRYRISGAVPPDTVAYCHCRTCQRSSGAPAMAWATFPAAGVWVTRGTPATYHSSAKGLRQFCRDCGTPLFFAFTEGPPELDVSVASLDMPEHLPPQYHIWTSSRLPWFDTADSLPRHADDGPDWAPERSG